MINKTLSQRNIFHALNSFIQWIYLILVIFTCIISCYVKKTKIENNVEYVYTNPERTIEERVENLLQLLTLEEKANFFSGKDLWHFEGVERLAIPSIQVTDCGHGITVILDEQGFNTGCATCFPTAVGQAASWNRQLVYDIGSAIAREARATGSTVLLAPMVNIHRTPLGGRNYETFSEDPYLTGSLAAAFIKGVQSEHIGACIKAMTANNQQTNQSHLSVEISERALREIYLPGFRIPVEEANPWAIMTSYNALNGKYTSTNKHLISDIVKKEWGYQGAVISDWRGVHSLESLPAGLDLEMPGPGNYLRKQDILQAFQDGMITLEEINNRVGRILRILIQSKLLDFDKPELKAELNSPSHKKLALKTAEESIVLLKNNKLLPLRKSHIKKIAIIGPNAIEARLGGGGSASVTPCYAINPLDGIKNYCSDSIEIVFEEGCRLTGALSSVNTEFLSVNDGSTTVQGLKAEFFNGKKLENQPVFTRIDDKIDFSWGWAAPCKEVDRNDYSVRWSGQINPPVSGKYKIGLTCNEGGCRLFVNNKLLIDEWGNPYNENLETKYRTLCRSVELNMEANYPQEIRVEFHKKMNRNSIRLEWEIPGAEDPIEAAVKQASECDAVVVFAGLSNLFEGGMNDRENLALPGEQDRLISSVAKANPNTVVVLINGSPVALPWIDEVDAIIEAYYPGQEGGNAIARILFGEANPSGKLPETFPKRLEDNPSYGNFPGENNRVFYKEGIYVGYRHYDTKMVEPLFPFGHGLSYTEFEYSNLNISEPRDGKITVQCNIKNTGKVAGKEIVQLYVRDVESSADHPDKELRQFTKICLKPGEMKRAEMILTENAFAYYDIHSNAWIVEPGYFEILIGSSSRDIRLQQMVLLP
jgi:beta-glucosidase